MGSGSQRCSTHRLVLTAGRELVDILKTGGVGEPLEIRGTVVSLSPHTVEPHAHLSRIISHAASKPTLSRAAGQAAGHIVDTETCICGSSPASSSASGYKFTGPPPPRARYLRALGSSASRQRIGSVSRRSFVYEVAIELFCR
jgi:hypothetical protein